MNVRKFKWLILLVVHDFMDNVNQVNLDRIINEEIRPTGINEEHALLLVYKSIRHQADKYSFKTRILELEKTQTGNFEFIEKKEEDFDFHDERSWIKLMEWVSTYYLAEYICLNTISHGAGFGMTGDGEDDKVEFGPIAIVPTQMLKNSLIDNESVGIENLPEKGVSLIKPHTKSASCKSLQMLWISEFSNALKLAYGRRKIDLVLFNNCFMQVYENAWMLSGNIKFAVAAETQFFSYGFDYKALLRSINQKIPLEPADLAKKIIPDFQTKWKKLGTGRLEDICVSALNLDHFEKMGLLFEKIALFLVNLSDDEIRDVISTRQRQIRSVTISPTNGGSGKVITIDLIYFFQLIAEKFSAKNSIVDAIQLFIEMFETCRIGIHQGTNLIKFDNRQTNTGKYRAQGLAIFMPFSLEGESRMYIMSCAYFGSVSRDQPADIKIPLLRFKKQSQWDDFIEKILKLL